VGVAKLSGLASFQDARFFSDVIPGAALRLPLATFWHPLRDAESNQLRT
jgi:hypothetical protein